MSNLPTTKSKLIAVIGDEVRWRGFCVYFSNKFVNSNIFALKDTVIGFLMSGSGELNKSRHPNYFIYDKSEFTKQYLIISFKVL